MTRLTSLVQKGTVVTKSILPTAADHLPPPVMIDSAADADVAMRRSEEDPLGVLQPDVAARLLQNVVALAHAYVLANLDGQLDARSLAKALGIGPAKLRSAVLAVVGEQLSPFTVNIRLDQARAWLSSDRELRTQAELAQALGWSSAAAFGKAYSRRYGETMSETRKREAR